MTSSFDRYLPWAAGLVIVLDLVAAVLAAVDTCAALLGSLLFWLATAIFLAGVLLPAGVSRLVAPVGARNLRHIGFAALSLAIPVIVFLVLPRTLANSGHCIA